MRRRLTQRQRYPAQTRFSLGSNPRSPTIGHYPNRQRERVQTASSRSSNLRCPTIFGRLPQWQRGRVESAFSAGSNPATVTIIARLAQRQSIYLTSRRAGVRSLTAHQDLRVSSNGRASVFQTEDESSILSTRSKHSRQAAVANQAHILTSPGSTPGPATTSFRCSSTAEQAAVNRQVVGSIPTAGANFSRVLRCQNLTRSGGCR